MVAWSAQAWGRAGTNSPAGPWGARCPDGHAGSCLSSSECPPCVLAGISEHASLACPFTSHHCLKIPSVSRLPKTSPSRWRVAPLMLAGHLSDEAQDLGRVCPGGQCRFRPQTWFQ